MASVTVIIPTYNRKSYLVESLVSIARQTRPADQVIVVDDGSTDGTGAVVDDVRREFFPGQDWPAFRYIGRKKNGGKSVAVNEALEDASSDLIWIFDDDDIAAPDRLATVVPYFDEDPGLDVVHTSGEWRDQVVVRPDGTISDRGWLKRHFWTAAPVPQRDQLRWFMTGCRWFGISVIWRRSILDRLTKVERSGFSSSRNDWPFDPTLQRAQDYDMWIRFLAAGAKVRAVERTTVYARIHDGARGIGHGLLDSDHVDAATQAAERRIFEKVRDDIPLFRIWPDGEKSDAHRSEAWVELAYAMYLRGLWADVAECLALATDVSILRKDHYDALNYIIKGTLDADGDDEKTKPLTRIRRTAKALRDQVKAAIDADPVLDGIARK